MTVTGQAEQPAGSGAVPHGRAAERLGGGGYRYTPGRRVLVEVLAEAGRPVGIDELVGAAARLPQSSIYRNLFVLEHAGVVTRHPGPGGAGLFELSEDLVGHHHHLVCGRCGRMEDYEVPAAVERDLEGALRSVMDAVAAGKGFRATGHRLELSGVCARCG